MDSVITLKVALAVCNYCDFFSFCSCRVYDIPFYIGVLVPFVIIYIFNWGIFVVIMFQLLKKRCGVKFKESSSNKQKMSFKQQFMIALTLSLLFGLGWGIGLLATQSLYTVTAIKDLFAALFILLTSFQGLFIFLMHCARSREVRREWTRWVYKGIGKEYSTSGTNSSASYFSKRTLGTQDCVKSNNYYLSRSATLKKYATKTVNNNSLDEDAVITGHELRVLEKELEAIDFNGKLANSDVIPSSPNHASAYPVPSEIRLSNAFTPDFYGSPPTSAGSGICANYENPLQKMNIEERMRFMQHRPSDLLSRTDSTTPCSNLPNPMLDTEDSDDLFSL